MRGDDLTGLSAPTTGPIQGSAKRQRAYLPLAARRAVRGGILGNYVDQFDIFLPIIALAPVAAQLFGA
ncbi:MAG: hypothetical protein ACYCZK_05665, partial [Microbacteriaceae bacterium]